MPKRIIATEQPHSSNVEDDDYDADSQTVRTPSSRDEDEVPELDFHEDNDASSYWS